MRWRRVVAAVVLLALAVVAGLLAADLRSWRSAIESGDVRFAQQPAAARWQANTALPFDPAFHIIGLSGQLAFRRAEKRFVAVSAEGNGVDNGFRESAARGALETVLTRLARSSDSFQASAADNLLGALTFLDSTQKGPSGPAPVERSEADFEAAVQANPANEDAKFNLELLLRELIAKGSRRGSNNSSGGPAKGNRGGAGGLPGRGY
ncbi:MAG TPA: hypothetical protein VGL76_08175 [Gaiellaceae bacterium]